jgi:hypothetical protein
MQYASPVCKLIMAINYQKEGDRRRRRSRRRKRN